MKLSINLTTLIWLVAGVLAVFAAWQNHAQIRAYFTPGQAASQMHASGGHPIVLVDITKLLNAQRAMASRFMGNPQDTDAISTLASAGKQADAVIRQIAGPNAIVLVKQAVVSWPGKTMPDITDAVLEKLGLPVDVPTVDYTKQMDVLPSRLTADPAMRSVIERNRVELKKKKAELKRRQNDSIVP